MSTPVLQVRDLRVDIGERTVLQSITLDVQPGSLTVLMGANGSGKSTLGMALAGHPHYKVTAGQAILDGKDLIQLPAHERARTGFFLSFQSPPDIPGVKNNLFIRTALNAVRESKGEAPLDAFDFLSGAKQGAKTLGMPITMLNRPVNEGFSGGERKKNEILQMSVLNPKLAMLDETDSGLDVDAVRIVSEGVHRFHNDQNAVLIITHHNSILQKLKPDFVHILIDGRIVKTGDASLVGEIEAKGYDAYKALV